MKTTIILILIACAITVGLAAPAFTSDAQETYLQGLQAYNAGKTDEALKAWSDVLSAKPDSDTTQSKAITALIGLVQDLTKKVDELQSQLNKTSLNPQTTSSTGGSGAATLTLKELKIVNSRGEVVISLRSDPANNIRGLICMHDPDSQKVNLFVNGGDKTGDAGIMITRPSFGSVFMSVIDSGGVISVKGDNDRCSMFTVNGIQ